ncbi:hypothetical protein OMO38_06950 [Chryseobacterium sp. 09-1422]|uniref:Prenyltransferase n=1 Tax=Chryseobacterium kimseyorum TaxID=2984028 RepID=A0ABT3HWV1_9FLAO|nr:hypothetical protein [Chryseobacterium kimseyorum]MCW3168261.1 hypothetical protein [Chryseobacterium kimseyorum]
MFNLNPKISLPAFLIFGCLMVVEFPQPIMYPAVFFLLIFIFHINRKDILFLQKIFISNWRLIIFLESAIIYSIFVMANINYKIDQFAVLFFAALISFAFFYPKKQIHFVLQWNFIPTYLFEWKSYLRKNTILVILGYLILVISSYNPASLILCGIFTFDFIGAIFEPNESKEMLEMYFRKYDFTFKLKKNVAFFNLLLLPTYTGFLIFNYTESFYLLYYIIFMNLYFLLILTRKYKIYSFKERGNYYGMIVFLEYFSVAYWLFLQFL